MERSILYGGYKAWPHFCRKTGKSDQSLVFKEYPYPMIIPLKLKLEIWEIIFL